MNETVKQAMVNMFISRYHLPVEDALVCLDSAIKEVHRLYQDVLQDMERYKDNAEILRDAEVLRQEMLDVEACWDKDEDNYSMDWRVQLRGKIQQAALPWCVDRINTLKSTLQEIHRLSSPANEQGKAE